MNDVLSSVPVAMRFGLPAQGAGQRADGRNDEHAFEQGVPPVGLDKLAHAPAGKGGAGVTEDARQPDGGGRGALCSEVGGGDADQALRPIDEEARGAKQQRVERGRSSRHLPE